MKMLSLLCALLITPMAFAATSLYDIPLKDINGKETSLKAYQGKVLLIVNVASFCGNTPQYKGLETLYRKYKNDGLVIVGVPANNFGGQEPGTDEDIKTFCTRNYDVTFPIMSKVSVKGGDITPLYGYLTQTGGDVKWNFTKFLVGKNGQVIQRFESKVEPMSPELTQAVEQAIK